MQARWLLVTDARATVRVSDLGFDGPSNKLHMFWDERAQVWKRGPWVMNAGTDVLRRGRKG